MSEWVERAEDLEVFPAGLPAVAGEPAPAKAGVRRAPKSICANLAEGFGRQRLSRPEFGRLLMMAIGSADEMQVWTMLLRSRLYRKRCRRALAGRVPGDRPHAAGPLPPQF